MHRLLQWTIVVWWLWGLGLVLLVYGSRENSEIDLGRMLMAWFIGSAMLHLISVPLIFVQVRQHRRDVQLLDEMRGGVCPYCAYTLSDQRERGRCPECGSAFKMKLLRRVWRSRFYRMRERD
ncbi:MAG: hypothetical protein ACOC0P_05710 [Planctomycetota bacterium]